MAPQHGRTLSAVLILGLVLAVCALILFGWLARETGEGETAHFDDEVRMLLHQHSSSALTRAMQGFTLLGSPFVVAPLAICSIVAFWLVGRRSAAALLSITLAGAALLNFVLKVFFHRQRPVPYFDTPLPHSYSFPSGHALISFCLFGTLAALITPHLQHRARRVIVWTSSVTLILLIGLSRIYLGVHYPTDVIAGYAAALVWVAAVGMVHDLHPRGKART